MNASALVATKNESIKLATSVKKIGVWMNHSVAHLMEFTAEPWEIKTITAQISQQEKEEEGVEKSQSTLFNRAQQQQTAFYRKLEEAIKNYQAVILFGPSYAKVTLFNLLQSNYHFAATKIVVKQADCMTACQQHAFVSAHFATIVCQTFGA